MLLTELSPFWDSNRPRATAATKYLAFFLLADPRAIPTLFCPPSSGALLVLRTRPTLLRYHSPLETTTVFLFLLPPLLDLNALDQWRLAQRKYDCHYPRC